MKDNLTVYSELLFAINDEVCDTILETACTSEYSEVHAYTAWINLSDKIYSDSNATKCQLQMEYKNLKMSKGQYPDIYISKLEKMMMKLNSKFGFAITEYELLIQVVNGIHKEFETIIN